MVHHILMFFKSTLTVPKIKDLVNSPNQKYKNIYEALSNRTETIGYTEIDLLPGNNAETIGYKEIDLIPDKNFNDKNFNNKNFNDNSISMKDELKSFLKKQLNNNSEDVIGLDINSETFSNF